MRYLVTGASGWIGSAVVPELIGAGHDVIGLARSDAAEEVLLAEGAEVRRGDLDDLDLLGAEAAVSDGVVHLAFRHDLAFSGDFPAAVEADRRAIETFGSALEGSDRPLVIASGILGLAQGRAATEADGQAPPTATPSEASGPEVRAVNARFTIGLASRGIRSSVVRLAPTVHGDGDNGFMSMLVGVARGKGVSAYVGDGSNRWPAVHRGDAAELFRLAVEKAPAGSVLHGAAEEGVPIRDVAAVIGRHLDLPVVSIEPEAAVVHFGWLGALLGADNPATSDLTRELLGWQPSRAGLLADLDEGHYFRMPSA